MKMFCFLLLITAFPCYLQAMVEGKPIAKKPRKLSLEEVQELEDYTWEVFINYDLNLDGEIEEEEVAEYLRILNYSVDSEEQLDEATIKERSEKFMRLVDKDGDGIVIYEELYQYFLEALEATE